MTFRRLKQFGSLTGCISLIFIFGKSNQQISDDIADLAAEELHALSVHLQAVMDLIEDTSV